MLSFILPRIAGVPAVARRSVSVMERNVAALKSVYWFVFVSGVIEPLLYLLSIGVGVGALIGDLTLPNGRVVDYATFVAPAMLSSSVMTGTLAETTYNFFGKLKYAKLYDGMLVTPLRPFEIALGELGWAMIRGAIYSAAFLVIMVAMGLTSASRAALAFPAAVLAGFAFGALGLAFSTFMRSWEDFDLVGAGQFALFLFSGTFIPAEAYPTLVRWLIEVTPLYRVVHLVRGVTMGETNALVLVDVAYLVGALAFGLTLAARRMSRLLYR